MKAKYTYRVIGADHYQPVTKMSELKGSSRWDQRAIVMLFYEGKCVGSGSLYRKGAGVSTDGVGLMAGCRRKGHGIWLYKAFIKAAMKIGATKISSSRHLNKFSKRMWSEKLAAIFDVKAAPSTCSTPCRHCRRRGRYYINLRSSK